MDSFPPDSASTSRRKQARGWLFAALAAVGSACFIVPYKVASDLASPAVLVVVLLTAAATFNTLASVPALRGGSLNRRAFGVATLMAGFTVAGNLGSTVALHLLHPAVASALLQTQVLYVAFAGHFILRESISRRWLVGAVCALVGVVLMRIPRGDVHLTLYGVVVANIAAFCFGMMHVITRKFIDRIDPLTVNALRLWIAVPLTLSIPGTLAAFSGLPLKAVIFTVIAAFFGPFLSRAFLMYSARHISAARAVLLSLATPAIALLLSALLFQTWPTLLELLGCCFILLGIVWPLLETLNRDSA